MAFEYNGFIHRDLEPQVRYDAEQVQLLKQADVTINESLQTINTEINGKLTKPANPSAESAVTMLADGTVGTKLLSEIGGGGKLYSYKYAGALSQPGSHGMPVVYVYFQFYLPYLTEINTYEKFRDICEKVYGKDTYIPVAFHRIGVETYYSGAFRFYKSDNDNYVRFFFGGITSDSTGSSPSIIAYNNASNPLIPPASDDVNKQWSAAVELTVTEL